MSGATPRKPSFLQRLFARNTPNNNPVTNLLESCGYCYVCGGREFSSSAVLWQELIDDWGINAEEVSYIDRQQGTTCRGCDNSLRCIALAKAILVKCNFPGTLRQFSRSKQGNKLKILSLNTAGGLATTLETFKGYQLAEYPEHDMKDLSFRDQTFDLVVHSDTLEHVPQPVLGLKECRRVLITGGSCIYTIPIIVSKLSADREGKKISYHGNRDTTSMDWTVQTEYGADAWKDCFQAGFSEVKIHCLEYPAAFAIECKKSV